MSIELASYIEHTILKAEAVEADIQKLCNDAVQHQFFGVCVQPHFVGFAADALRGRGPKVVTVVGFPLGADVSTTKAYAAREAVRMGADEIDMVLNLSALKGLDHALVLDDIRSVVQAVPHHPVKVILETAALTEHEKIIACTLSKAAGAAFVKTSTGFHASGGATAEDVRLMRAVVGSDLGVKASGGIRSPQAAQAMVEAGASRLGTSSSVAIVSH